MTTAAIVFIVCTLADIVVQVLAARSRRLHARALRALVESHVAAIHASTNGSKARTEELRAMAASVALPTHREQGKPS